MIVVYNYKKFICLNINISELQTLDSFGYIEAKSALFIEQLSKNINCVSNCYQGNCSYRTINSKFTDETSFIAAEVSSLVFILV